MRNRKSVSGISTNTLDAKAHESHGSSVNNSFEGRQSTGKQESRHKSRNSLMKLIKTTISFNLNYKEGDGITNIKIL